MTQNAIEARGLTKRFGQQTAVDDLDLVVPKGQMLALLGPNGAGKSTLTEMLTGLTRPDGGTVTVLGRTPVQATREGRIGAMLQGGSMLDDVPVRTALGVVRAVCAHPRPLDQVVDRAQIGPLLGKQVGRLSGGEAQRVRFALALLPDPEVVLLDEPTVAMDVELRRKFWQGMRAVADEGRTIVFATHYLEEADQESDRIVVLNKGRLIADGTGSQIKARIGGKHISLQCPEHWGAGERDQQLGSLPGVTSIDHADHGRTRLVCANPDQTLAALFAPDGPYHHELVTDIEVTSPSLEDAFLELTN